MHVAITGASSGIGAGLAKAWGRRKAKLTLVARRKELLEQVATESGADACVLPRDLSKPDEAVSWLAEAEARHGPIDVLVNNAGIENMGMVLRSDPDEGQRVLTVNLLAPLLLTRAVAQQMAARRSGTIVQVASVAALSPPLGQAWYGASKAGLANFSEVLRAELAPTGVNVLTVYPGPVRTAMADSAYSKYGGRVGSAALGPEGTVERLAELVLSAVDRRRARVIYPRVYTLAWWLGPFARWVTSRFGPRPVG